MNLYKTYGKGMALGSQCVIAAPTELRAKQLHYAETGFICDKIEVVEKKLYLEVNDKPQKEYVFYSWNGDYRRAY